jgi:hypothetical protein
MYLVCLPLFVPHRHLIIFDYYKTSSGLVVMRMLYLKAVAAHNFEHEFSIAAVVVINQ